MNTVRELINESLFTIGVKKEGISSQVVDGESDRNLKRFQMIFDQSRNLSPYNFTEKVSFEDLLNINFSVIESVVGINKGTVNSIRYPMKEISLSKYNDLNITPIVGGIPEYYYFEKIGLIKTYPQELSSYEFYITGKVKSLSNITLATELESVPLIFRNYLMLLLAKRLSIVYSRKWGVIHQQELTSAISDLEINSDIDTTMEVPTPFNIREYRPRNFIRG